MKLAYSKFIPFEGFYCINLFGYLIRREKYRNEEMSNRTWNHEGIHEAQAMDFCKWKPLGYCIFYICYFLEWLVKLVMSIFTLGKVKAYYSLSYEQEAYEHQYNPKYTETRKRFAWAKYIFTVVKK